MKKTNNIFKIYLLIFIVTTSIFLSSCSLNKKNVVNNLDISEDIKAIDTSKQNTENDENIQIPDKNAITSQTNKISTQNDEDSKIIDTHKNSNSLLSEDVDMEVNDYKNYLASVQSAVKNNSLKLKIRTLDYSEKYLNISTDDLISYNKNLSSLNIKSSYIDNIAILNIDFSYTSHTINNNSDLIPSTDAISISSVSEYKTEITKALNNFSTNLVLQINNFDINTYKTDIVTSLWYSMPLRYSGGINVNANYSTLSNNSSQAVMTITIDYLDYNSNPISSNTLIKWKSTAELKASSIIGSIIKNGMSDSDKALAIHDYIINNTTYNESGQESHTDYGVLVNGFGVCEGYASAFYRLCKLAGLDCKIITGTTSDGGAHAWNQVLISDTWYYVDTTWDDPIGGSLRYDYFLTETSPHNVEETFK